MSAKKWRRLRRLFGADPAREVDDEIAFHLEMRTGERIAAGEDPAEARARALRRFGDVEAARAEALKIDQRKERHMRRALYTSELRQDIAYAVRALRRRPGFAAIAVVTLALGVGANSAIFSVVHGVLLKPLPYRAADELMMVRTEYTNGTAFPLSAPDFMSVHDESRAFQQVAALTPQTVTLTGTGEPRDVSATLVSKGLFELLGLAPIAGRTFSAEEYVRGSGVALVAAGFANRVFGGASTALQQTVTLAGNPYTVVGVMRGSAEIVPGRPRGSARPDQAEVYMPLPYDSTYSSQTNVRRRSEFLTVLGRLRTGVTRERADEDMRRLGAELERRFPQTNENITLQAQPLAETLVGDVRRPLLVLLGAVGLVLLVACANVANLMLARATAREGELAIRAALGAGRGRLVRQLVTESIVLSGAGAVLGLLLAWWGTRALVAAQPADIPRLDEIGIDGNVVAFTAGVALVTGLLFGTFPALQATGGRMMHAIREGGRGALAGIRGQRMRAALVCAELALAVMLLFGAGLLIRSFIGLTRVDTGFNAENAITFRVSLQGSKYASPEVRRQFYTGLEERLRALPGVTHVGAATGLPMTGGASLLGPFNVEGMDVPPNVLPEIRVVTVTPTYFDALGTPMLMGRMLDERDRADAPLVAVMNRASIGRWFPDGNPVGKRIVLGGQAIEVVGVVADVLQRAPGVPVEPEMYWPYAQQSARTMRYVVRGRGDMTPIATRIRTEVHALDPQLPLQSVDPLASVISNAVARPRLYTTLLTLFAGVALALAVVGIFGVMSYVVTQRAREISIRMALGADGSRVVGMVVGGALKIAAAGMLIGFAGAWAFGRVLQNQLFGVRLLDPLTLVGVLVLLGGSAAVASFLPARRAARLDPGMALREG
jgi:predicted permease